MKKKEAVQPTKVFIGVPIYRENHHKFNASVMALAMKPPVSFELHQSPGDSLITRARNRIAAAFLKSDCTHFLFLDNDLEFSPAQIKRLVDHDVDIVCGIYPKKQKELEWVMNTFGETKADSRGLLKIKYAGTGALMVKRKVLMDMIEAFPEISYDADSGETPGRKWDFYPAGVYKFPDASRRYLSEDWYFCQRALDLGYDIYADMQNVFYHWDGGTRYPLCEIPLEPLVGSSAQPANGR